MLSLTRMTNCSYSVQVQDNEHYGVSAGDAKLDVKHERVSRTFETFNTTVQVWEMI